MSLRYFCALLLLAASLSGCGSGGGDRDGQQPSVNNNWDEMHWNQGSWA